MIMVCNRSQSAAPAQKRNVFHAIDSPAFTNFHPTVVVVHRAVISVAHFGEIVFGRQLEEQGNIFKERGLIFLDGQQIVGTLVNYLCSNLGLRTNGIDDNDAATDIQQP